VSMLSLGVSVLVERYFCIKAFIFLSYSRSGLRLLLISLMFS
jgi:hypothetical protein